MTIHTSRFFPLKRKQFLKDGAVCICNCSLSQSRLTSYFVFFIFRQSATFFESANKTNYLFDFLCSSLCEPIVAYSTMYWINSSYFQTLHKERRLSALFLFENMHDVIQLLTSAYSLITIRQRSSFLLCVTIDVGPQRRLS